MSKPKTNNLAVHLTSWQEQFDAIDLGLDTSSSTTSEIMFDDLAKDVKYLTPEEFDTKGEPVFEVSSVSISIDKFKELYDIDSLMGFYGYIKLIVNDSDEFYLFDQPQHKLIGNDSDEFYLFDQPPHCANATIDLSMHHSDILQGYRHTHYPFLLPKSLKLYIFVEDRLQDFVIDECFQLDWNGKFEYDKKQHLECKSKQAGLAFVNYTVFQYAVIARVSVWVERNDHCDPGNVSCGTISASYKLGHSTCSRTFYHDPSTPRWTCWFAVPSYSSSLQLECDLMDNGTRRSANFKFKVSDVSSGTYWQTHELGPNLTMYAKVEWILPTDLVGDDPPHRSDISEVPDGTDLTKTKSWVLENADVVSWDAINFNPEMRFRNMEHHQKQEQRYDPPPALPHALVEVYSVYVYAYEGGYLSVYGTIEYSDSMGQNYCMFKTDVEEAVPFKSCVSLPLIQAGRCSLDFSFKISLDLKDIDGREISKGSLEWDCTTGYCWYYRLISSVFAGSAGYAVVNYSLFPNAIEAKLKIEIDSRLNTNTSVCGRISTRYDMFKYFSPDEKIYESVWFERSHLNSVQIKGKETICLSKHAVVAPLDVGLIVHVDLCVWDGSEITLLRVAKTFDPPGTPDKEASRSSQCQEIREHHDGLVVSVEWNEAVRSHKLVSDIFMNIF